MNSAHDIESLKVDVVNAHAYYDAVRESLESALNSLHGSVTLRDRLAAKAQILSAKNELDSVSRQVSASYSRLLGAL